MPHAEVRRDLQGDGGRRPNAQCAPVGALDRRPFDGIAEGDAQLEHVGAAGDEGLQHRQARLGIGIAEHRKGNEGGFLRGGMALKAGSVTRQCGESTN